MQGIKGECSIKLFQKSYYVLPHIEVYVERKLIEEQNQIFKVARGNSITGKFN